MFTKSNKVQFQDHQLDDYLLENSVLKSKLQSKVDALSIMSKELDKCSMERDRYKLLVEQIKCNKIVFHENINSFNGFTPANTISGSEILAKTNDHNNSLKLEVESLKSKLEDANGDISALRKQLQNCNGYNLNNVGKIYSSETNSLQYEKLVQDLEMFQKKYQQIQLDYRATLDEKEELVSDRDYYKDKVQHLNHQISYLLSNSIKIHSEVAENPETNGNLDLPKPVIDIDALLAENKYLHERITQLQVEKDIVKRNLTKYKTLLDNRGKSPTKLKRGLADVMTQKQVREYLDNDSKMGLKRSSAAEMKSLCLGLIEALNDKSIALKHQRKTNQILANRITELEKTLESWCNGQKCIPIFPSQMLIEEILNDTSSIKSEEYKGKNDKGVSENVHKMIEGVDGIQFINDKEFGFHEERYKNNSENQKHVLSSKTILPQELEELVKEALAELKSEQ